LPRAPTGVETGPAVVRALSFDSNPPPIHRLLSHPDANPPIRLPRGTGRRTFAQGGRVNAPRTRHRPLRLRRTPSVFLALLSGAFGGPVTGAASAAPVEAGGSRLVWSIGKTDNSGDEFARGSARTLAYDVSGGAGPKAWREQQTVGDDYLIRFDLQRPAAPGYRLVVNGFFMEAGPAALDVVVNGRTGAFRLQPRHGADLDFRDGVDPLFTVVHLQIPIDPAWLKSGPNAIRLGVSGDGGGTLYYDSVLLEAVQTPPPVGDSVAVEPTLFFLRRPSGLVESTDVVVTHRARLTNAAVTLKVGSANPLAARIPEDGPDFGETVVAFDIPATTLAEPWRATLRTARGAMSFRGEFRPDKRWKLYLGLKIHNDVGYTDLQENARAAQERDADLILDALAAHPAHKFNLENSWLAETYLHSRTPPRAKELLEMARQDRLGISAIYLNLLTGLCSGEELYRSLYFAESLHRKYGVPVTSAALTDTPSQSWGLASVLADSGITGFALGSNQHRGPLLINGNLNEESPFYWQGPDGRRVLTFVARAYHQFKRLDEGNSVPLMARNIAQFLARYQRPDYPLDALYVLGDLGENQDARDAGVRAIARWNATYAYPKLIPATDADYFGYVARHFGSRLPVFRGGMGSYWADAAGTSTGATIENRDAQHLMPTAEMMASWASLLSPDLAYPAAAFREGWEQMLFYDEHTWGANDSITQPGERFVTGQFAFKRAHAERASRIAHHLLTLSLARIVQRIPVDRPLIMVFNPDVVRRTDVVDAELDANQQIYDLATGRPVPTDVVAEHPANKASGGNFDAGGPRAWREVRFLAQDVPGLGYRSYGIRREPAAAPATDRSLGDSWTMDGRFYRVALDPATGAIKSIIDRQAGRELVDPRAPYEPNELVYAAGGKGQTIVDNLHGWAPTHLDVSGQVRARLIEHVRTPFGERIRIEARARNVPLIDSEITIYDRLKRIDLVDHIRKRPVLDKEAVYFAFPFLVSPPTLRYQVQNGWVRPDRDLLPGACLDYFTTQNLVLASDPAITIAFATPDLPLVTLTDLNRGRWARRFVARNGTVYSYVANNYWDTNVKAAQGGNLVFRYYLTSFPGLDFDRASRFDSATRRPLIAYRVRRWFSPREAGPDPMAAASGSLLSVDAPNVQISAFKRAEDGDGYIVRLLETSGRASFAHLRSMIFPIVAAYLTNGVEEGSRAIAVRDDEVAVPLAPHRFSTVRIIFAPRPNPSR
jgi:alpha-mannosidase